MNRCDRQNSRRNRLSQHDIQEASGCDVKPRRPTHCLMNVVCFFQLNGRIRNTMGDDHKFVRNNPSFIPRPDWIEVAGVECHLKLIELDNVQQNSLKADLQSLRTDVKIIDVLA